MMKLTARHIFLAALCATALTGAAQTADNHDFALKASAEFGLTNSFSISSALPGLTGKASETNYGLGFGWTFFRSHGHSLEANVGVALAYSPSTVTLDLGALDYNYAASAAADMDGEAYQRYYELSGMSQKVSASHLTLPIYLTYAYRCTGWLNVHADAGIRLGFITGSGLDKVSGKAFSYGVYPQYDDLIIDADYMNGFGNSDLSAARHMTPESEGFNAALLVGAGAEFRIYGPLSADLSLRYNIGLTDMYKGSYKGGAFTESTAPVSYTVAGGQTVRPLTDYLRSSKLSQLSLRIALIYRF